MAKTDISLGDILDQTDLQNIYSAFTDDIFKNAVTLEQLQSMNLLDNTLFNHSVYGPDSFIMQYSKYYSPELFKNLFRSYEAEKQLRSNAVKYVSMFFNDDLKLQGNVLCKNMSEYKMKSQLDEGG